MKSSSSYSSSSRSPPQHKYDVFLSFHGKDTRKSFADHLYAALNLRGIVTFKDDINLDRGENINYGLPKAIEESRISLVVFSKNYAESEWCLEELVKMMECSKRSHQQHAVLPIFYDVEPSEVRAQKGSVADSLAKHQNCGRKVEKWKEALHDFVNLSGFVMKELSSGHEAKNIQIIVRDIEDKLNHVSLSIVDRPVGIESRLHRLIKMLNMDHDDTRIIAIWGIGGIGKTEVAKAVYNMIHKKFEGSSFIADVRATSDQPNGIVILQRQILSDILKIENHNIRSVYQGIELIKRRIFCRKVLLVLDDVDDGNQLKELAIDRNFLCHGSKIIITTRVLSSVNSLEVDEVYEPGELNERESTELFSWRAFKQDHPMEDYMELSNEVVSYLKGIPLALEVIGSLLFKKTKSVWRSAIKELKTIPNHKVQKKLKISFDSLSDERKELFLDIACFFVGRNQDFTIQILEGCDFHPEIGMQELVERCLLKYDQSNKIMMHDLLRDMGREIIRQESVKEPGKRSRLWHHKDAFRVLTEGTGTKNVEGLFLDFPEPRDIQANAKAFKKMVRLRLLQLNYVQLSVGYKHIISRRLVLICWKGFPLDCMPSNLHMENLVYLDLSYSSLKYVWIGTKILDKLKFLYLNHCSSLIETPDFTGLSNLIELSLNDCTSLVEVSDSISYLNKIVVLDMKNCKELEKLPFGIWMMKSLESLDLSGCSNLINFAGFKGSPSISWHSYVKNLIAHNSSYSIPKHVLEGTEVLNKLKILDLSHCSSLVKTPGFFPLANLEKLSLCGCTSLVVVDESISCLNKLDCLDMRNCKKLRTLPFGIWMLKSLESLDLSGCSNLINFAGFKGSPSVSWCSFVKNLIAHDSSYSSPKEVLEGTEVLNKLKILDLSHCSSLVKTPKFFPLGNLEKLSLYGCTSLVVLDESISCLNKLKFLDMGNCKKLRTLPFGIWMLKSLEHLDLSGCSNLRNFAGFKGSPSTLLYSFFLSWISPASRVGSVDLQVPKNCLKFLRIAGCNLSYIPSEIGYLTSLEELDISQNNFSTLPDSMGDLLQLKCLYVHESRRLQSIPKLPPSLVTMLAHMCISLESISIESNWPKKNETKVICYGSPKLAENNFADRCSKGLLQYKEISAIESSFDIFLTGGEVPNWFEYRSTGSYLSFVASTNILGWIACATFTLPKEGRYIPDNPKYFIRKNSNGCERVHRPSYHFGAPMMVHNTNINVMWFSYLPLSAIKMQVKCDDEVKVLLKTLEPFQVIEWGISLIHKDEKEKGEEEVSEEEERSN